MRLWIAVVIAAAGCTPGDVRPVGADAARAPVVTLGLITGLEGKTEPCGCTSKPLGGLDRLATRVEALRKETPFALLTTGNTFFAEGDATLPDHRQQQEAREATAIARILEKLQPAAMVAGAFDARERPTVVTAIPEANGLPLFSGPRGRDPKLKADSLIITLGGLRVGLIGNAHTSRIDAYNSGAVALRAQGADVVVALLAEGGDAAKLVASQLSGINVAIGGGGGEPREPEVVSGTLLLDAGDRGQHLGLVRFHREPAPAPAKTEGPDEAESSAVAAAKKDPAAWVYDDGGAVQRRSLERRIDGLRSDVERLPVGDARSARANKLATLEERLAAFVPAKPSGRHVTFAREDIGRDVVAAPWAREILVAHNRSLCDLLGRATAGLTCTPPTSAAAAYIGNDACSECHEEAVAVWRKTPHAAAFETLTDDGKACDLGCLGCHTVGYDLPGGWCRLEQAKAYADVGCEACHGPGSGHAEAPEAELAGFSRARDVSVCLRCHTSEHSDTFDFETYLPRILGPGHSGE